MKNYTIYKCKTCNRHFILYKTDVSYSEKKNRYIACPFHGKHRNIVVVGAYDSIHECMDHRSYKRKRGRMQQSRR